MLLRRQITETIIQYIASFLVVLLVLPVHEFAHAFAAVKSGDPTPKFSGRYTLNPLKHFDLLGLIMLVVVHFGWAKPVPINPNNFRKPRINYFWVAVAGVIANIIMAFVFSLFYVLFFIFAGNVKTTATVIGKYALMLLDYILRYGVFININLFVFNLLPVYPLDGFRVLEAADKKRGKVFWFLRTKGGYVLLALLLIGAICGRIGGVMGYFDVLGNTIGFVSNKIANAFIAFWKVILT